MFIYSCSVYEETLLTDSRDGKMYPIVKIGNQCWMGSNLAYLPRVYPANSDSGFYVYGYEGRDITQAKQTIEFCNYGCLYNWAVAMNLPLEANEKFQYKLDTNIRGICPEGWHIPSNNEVMIMEKLLETYSDFEKKDERRHTGDVGKKLKTASGWYQKGNGTNESGLSINPSGMRYQDGYFTKAGQYGYFWTSTEAYDGSAYYRYMVYNSDGTYIGFPSKKIGMPVRCIKD